MSQPKILGSLSPHGIGEDSIRYAQKQGEALMDLSRLEICICAAIKLESGEIFRGHRHNDCLRTWWDIPLEHRPKSHRPDSGVHYVTQPDLSRLQKVAKYLDRHDASTLEQAQAADLLREAHAELSRLLADQETLDDYEIQRVSGEVRAAPVSKGHCLSLTGSNGRLHTAKMKHAKRPRDTNQLAKMVVALTTREAEELDQNEGKDLQAVQRGRKGGLKGGTARAANLSPQKRRQIAKKAAAARWRSR